jgi:ketosteroid isomerase-like protein
MFDFPDTLRGIEDYQRTWDFLFDNQIGPMTFSSDNMEVTAGV